MDESKETNVSPESEETLFPLPTSETSFMMSGIRPKIKKFMGMVESNDMMWLPPIPTSSFTKNDGADYLLHIDEGQFNQCPGKAFQVAVSCSGLSKETYDEKVLDEKIFHLTLFSFHPTPLNFHP